MLVPMAVQTRDAPSALRVSEISLPSFTVTPSKLSPLLTSAERPASCAAVVSV